MTRSIKKLSLTKASSALAEYVENLQGIPLVVTVKGKPVAALVPIEGLDWEGLSLGTNPDFLDLLERSRRSALEKGTISHEEVCRRFGLPPPGERAAKRNGRKAVSRTRKKARSS